MNVALPTINVLELCAGAGMLGVGFSRGCELSGLGAARSVCHIEREAFAAAVLAARMETSDLDAAPIWSDLLTFDGRAWRGLVDAVIAGLPCQPYSVAGAQRGHEDERAIWPVAFDIIEQVRPALVFLENVPGQLKFFQPIGERLCSMGFRFEAGLFSAEEVGASHKRERFFVLAHSRLDERWRRILGAKAGIRPDEFRGRRSTSSSSMEDSPRNDGSGIGRELRMRRGVCETSNPMAESCDRFISEPRLGSQQRDGLGSASEDVADAGCSDAGRPDGALRSGHESGGRLDVAGDQLAFPSQRGLGELREPSRSDRQPDVGVGLANSRSQRSQGIIEAGAETRPTGRSSGTTLPRFAPGPSDPRWPAIIDAHPELAPFCLTLGSDEDAASQPTLRALADGHPNVVAGPMRVYQLRIVGNGVVPDTAALAFSTLWERLMA